MERILFLHLKTINTKPSINRSHRTQFLKPFSIKQCSMLVIVPCFNRGLQLWLYVVPTSSNVYEIPKHFDACSIFLAMILRFIYSQRYKLLHALFRSIYRQNRCDCSIFLHIQECLSDIYILENRQNNSAK